MKLQTCSSGEPNERHFTRMDTAPALRADSTGGNSDLDSKRLKSWRAPTLVCIAPFPLSITNICIITLKPKLMNMWTYSWHNWSFYQSLQKIWPRQSNNTKFSVPHGKILYLYHCIQNSHIVKKNSCLNQKIQNTRRILSLLK